MEVDDDDDSEYEFGKIGKDAYDVDDEQTVYGSTNPSRFSSMKQNGSTMRRRFGQSSKKDVESPAPIDSRFADIGTIKAQKNARNRRLVRELKRGDRVNVKIQPLCLFLFRDGTVISVHKGEFASVVF